MEEQLINDANALRLFFSDDIFLIKDDVSGVDNQFVEESKVPVKDEAVQSVVVTKAEPPVESGNKIAFKYLGQNKRRILILVNDGSNEVSTERGRELLRNIVKSIKLSSADFALLNYSAYSGVSFKELDDYFKSVTMLVFGVTPAVLGLGPLPNNELIKLETTKVIFAANLDAMAEDQAEKKQFWAALKQIDV